MYILLYPVAYLVLYYVSILIKSQYPHVSQLSMQLLGLFASVQIPYSKYFWGGKIFVVFVIERRTTKFSPMKQYCIVPGCGLVYHKNEKFFPELAKNSLLTKILPPKKYPLYGSTTIALFSITELSSACAYCRFQPLL